MQIRKRYVASFILLPLFLLICAGHHFVECARELYGLIHDAFLGDLV